MARYHCRNCGYAGHKLIFQLTDHTYCVATNAGEPDYESTDVPGWVRNKHLGDAKIGAPVGCPKCRAWGTSNFQRI
jgi:hypothetical protein